MLLPELDGPSSRGPAPGPQPGSCSCPPQLLPGGPQCSGVRAPKRGGRQSSRSLRPSAGLLRLPLGLGLGVQGELPVPGAVRDVPEENGPRIQTLEPHPRRAFLPGIRGFSAGELGTRGVPDGAPWPRPKGTRAATFPGSPPGSADVGVGAGSSLVRGWQWGWGRGWSLGMRSGPGRHQAAWRRPGAPARVSEQTAQLQGPLRTPSWFTEGTVSLGDRPGPSAPKGPPEVLSPIPASDASGCPPPGPGRAGPRAALASRPPGPRGRGGLP